MAYLLPHLETGYAVDQAIVTEEERVVCLRFGHDYDEQCMLIDESLRSVAELTRNFAVVYVVDITQVPEFNEMYELLTKPINLMFFYRNKHIMVDCGTGNNNKIDWPLTNKQELVDIIETVYRGATKGKGLVMSPKDYSTSFKY